MVIKKKTKGAHVWDRPKTMSEALTRATRVDTAISQGVLEVRMMRNLLERISQSDYGDEKAKAIGIDAWVRALVLGELRVERANLRRWVTNHKKQEGAH